MSAAATLAKPLVEVLRTIVEAANSLSVRIKAETSGAEEKVSAVLTTSDDPELVAWRKFNEKGLAQIAEAQARLAEAKAGATARAEKIVADSVESGEAFDVEAAKKEFLSKRQEATAIRGAIKTVLGGDADALTKFLADEGIAEMVSLRGSAGTTTGTGKRKPRLAEASINGENIDKPTFTILGQRIGIDIDVLKEAAFKAAETDDLSSKAGEEISFTVVNKAKETVTVVIVPKASGNSKPETDSDSESE